MMITVYEIKSNGHLGASKQIDPREGVSNGWTYTAPPGDGVHEWTGGAWVPREREPEPFVPGPNTDAVAKDVRAERDARLVACDWTQVADAPVDKDAWAAYRQALRDLPQQEGFPMSVVWPEKP